MTVNYDANDHLGVIFRIHGSVLFHVLPWCAFNVAMACLVWTLRTYGICNLTFNGGLGYQYISVLVSFFVVSNVNTSYNRFWEARGFLGRALFAAAKLAMRAGAYSRKETHDRAKMWRKVVGIRLSRLLQYSMHAIQNDRASTINTKTDNGDLEEEHRLIARECLGEELNYDPSVATLTYAVDVAVLSHADFLDSPLHLPEQMDLLGKTNDFLNAFDGLLKNSSTPRPFPSVQMGRTLLILWVLSLPFALGGKLTQDTEGLLQLMFLVFLVTYGFVGLMAAEIEMHDPYGDDANDLEVKKYTAIILKDIDIFLLGKADLSSVLDLKADLGRCDAAVIPPKESNYGAVV